MAGPRAIDLALDLARMPALAAVMRKQTLPSDLVEVIRIAAGCPETSRAAAAARQKPLRVIRTAAIFYLEEMLFFPGADLHRNLGVSVNASKPQMRLHMRWLLQWLHPDHNSDEIAALLAARVIKAWQELGRLDRPEGGAESSARQQFTSRRPGRATMRVRWIGVPIRPSVSSARKRRQRAVILVVAVLAVASILVPGVTIFGWPSFLGAKIPLVSAMTHAEDGASIVDGTHK
jgi:hypothetical protein